MQSVSSEQVDRLVAQLVSVAIEHTIQERCTQVEAAMVRAMLDTPAVARLRDRAGDLVMDALELALPPLLNECLFPED
jgi:SHS2 domain-containing protein